MFENFKMNKNTDTLIRYYEKNPSAIIEVVEVPEESNDKCLVCITEDTDKKTRKVYLNRDKIELYIKNKQFKIIDDIKKTVNWTYILYKAD